MIKQFKNKQPHLGRNVYISENAAVIGEVMLGNEVNIWFGAVVRGDMHYIKIDSRSNVQDNAVVHVLLRFPLQILDLVSLLAMEPLFMVVPLKMTV